ncbi:MAG TPA: thiamine pyrophosphate-binding protein [Chloroflexi bacterium]|nr:thiamine pyrophosphate-binding protein [Chloroflexota bacterium]
MNDLPASSQALVAGLEKIDPEFLLYLPCGTAARVLSYFISKTTLVHFPVAREEEGIGILSGLVLAGRRAVLLIQDTGLGNSMTALATFPQVYHLPICIVATRTGGRREINSAVHRYSEHLPGILTAAGISYESLDVRVPLSHWPAIVAERYQYARVSHRPVVILIDLKESRPNAGQN